jgi:hypothetical protein
MVERWVNGISYNNSNFLDDAMKSKYYDNINNVMRVSGIKYKHIAERKTLDMKDLLNNINKKNTNQ